MAQGMTRRALTLLETEEGKGEKGDVMLNLSGGKVTATSTSSKGRIEEATGSD